MNQSTLKVSLLESPKNPLSVIYSSYRQCYSTQYVDDIWKELHDTCDKASFVERMVQLGHESPLEHVSFTFAIDGISLAATNHLVKYRIGSYSQQNQRYVNKLDFEYVVPPSIAEDEKLHHEFTKTMENIRTSYNRLIDLFSEKEINGYLANEDARFILPQATSAKIVLTMNCRQLLHFFQHSFCNRAQWEIRAAAYQMFVLCRMNLPAVFASAGARCEAQGLCPETEKFSCGKYSATIRGDNAELQESA